MEDDRGAAFGGRESPTKVVQKHIGKLLTCRT